MSKYATVLAVLHLALGMFCYQPPNSDPNAVMVPGLQQPLWNVPNYIKNWAEMGRPQPVLVNLGNGEQSNSLGDIDERFLDKRQDVSMNNPFNGMLNAGDSSSAYLDADAATVAAMQYELQTLVQTKYQAEAAIKMETGEIARTQHEAQEAERALEEATNSVRIISAHLKTAQEEASKAATRALTAQLQMSVHDQLLVTARQKLNSVTAHMIALQADLASAQQRFMLNNSTKELENRAHTLHIRPENNVIPIQNGEVASSYGDASTNYLQQLQRNSATALSPAEFWHQQLETNPQQSQPNWPLFNQLTQQDLQKSSNTQPLYISSKKI